MSFGWAYVDCGTSAGGQAAGPTGSVQFLTGANSTSGSANLLYHTSAYGGYTANTLVMTGTLVIDGIVSASHYHIENVTEIDSSGSTYFGNSDNDLHSRTGSLVVIDEANNKILSASTSTEAVHVRGLNVLYESIVGTSVTASAPSYILGVQNTSNVEILIPSASIYGSGSLLLVKDEVIRVGTNIRLSASSGYTIDGTDFYILTGTLPAISLYSNGANWFVF